MHKVPTLRNVDRRADGTFVKAYMHNGYFKSLSGLVHFYNTRDAKAVCPGLFTSPSWARCPTATCPLDSGEDWVYFTP
jgi:hypothetical protein